MGGRRGGREEEVGEEERREREVEGGMKRSRDSEKEEPSCLVGI